ncbi:MAG: hypothetical protein AABX01_06200 [Candidatus Micrarchaeota archaeon]
MAKLDTSIDRLVEYIKMKKSCTVDDVSKALGMGAKQVEELSEILAESGLIDVRYEFSGIRLFPKIVKKEGLDDAAGKAKVLSVVDRLEGVKRELTDAENMFIFSGRDIIRKVENAKAHFREIEKLSFPKENAKELDAKMNELDSSLLIFEEKIAILQQAAVDIKQEVDAFKAQVQILDPSRKTGRIKFPSLGNFIRKITGKMRRNAQNPKVDA